MKLREVAQLKNVHKPDGLPYMVENLMGWSAHCILLHSSENYTQICWILAEIC